MAVTGLFPTAASTLTAQVRRIGGVADTVVNQNTEGFRPRDLRTISVNAERAPGGAFSTGGGVTTALIEEDDTDTVEQYARLLQARTAYGAALETTATAEVLAEEPLRVSV